MKGREVSGEGQWEKGQWEKGRLTAEKNR